MRPPPRWLRVELGLPILMVRRRAGWRVDRETARRVPDGKPTTSPRWLRVRSDYPRAASFSRAWCRSDGESHPTLRWALRTTAHVRYGMSLARRGVHDTRWTVLR